MLLLVRMLSCHSGGQINKRVVLAKLFLTIPCASIAFYGLLVPDFSICILGIGCFVADYLLYRTLMRTRYLKIQELSKNFTLQKLLEVEGFYSKSTPKQMKELSVRYFNGKKFSGDEKYVATRIKNVNRRLILHVGCGLGYLTITSSKQGASSVAVDINKTGLCFISSISKKNEYDVSTIVSDAQYLPFKEETFDCVLACNVMEHLKSDLKGFAESFRVLKRKGEFICSVPSEHSPVYALSALLFNPMILMERVLSWKMPSLLPARIKYVFLAELFERNEKKYYSEISIHKRYVFPELRQILFDIRFESPKITGTLCPNDRLIPFLNKLVERAPFLANNLVAFCKKHDHRCYS